jgi:hypothetical protein
MERLTNEEEDLIFEIEQQLFSIDTITLSKETISLMSVTVLKINSIEEFDPEQGIEDQTTTKEVPSIVRSKDFCVKPEVSLEDKVYLETYYHRSQDDIQVDETLAKIQI